MCVCIYIYIHIHIHTYIYILSTKFYFLLIIKSWGVKRKALTSVQYMRSLTVVIPCGPGPACLSVSPVLKLSIGKHFCISAAAQSMQVFPVSPRRPPQALCGTAAAVFFWLLSPFCHFLVPLLSFPSSPWQNDSWKDRLFPGRNLHLLDFHICNHIHWR